MKKYQNIPWNFVKTYGITFSRVDKISNNSAPFSTIDPTSVQIYKLHGSLNWVYRVRSGTDPQNSIRKPRSGLISVNDQLIWKQLKEPVKGPRKGFDVIPLIVPPIYEKSQMYGEILRPVWQNANQALVQTEELVIFGYSFPDADFASKALIRQAVHHNRRLRTVHVIDTNPGVAAKVAKILEAPSCNYYKNATTFSSLYGN